MLRCGGVRGLVISWVQVWGTRCQVTCPIEPAPWLHQKTSTLLLGAEFVACWLRWAHAGG